MFLTATMFAIATTTASMTPGADDFLASLKEMGVAHKDVAAAVDVNDGVDIEVSYNLRRVGAVSIAAHGDDDGSGHGQVVVGNHIVAEFKLARGTVSWKTVDFTSFRPKQAKAIAASVVQVWHEDVIAEALTGSTESSEARSLKCVIAGGIAGATAGILVGATCGIFIKNPVTCGKAGGGAYGYASFYVANKCSGAQNK